MFFQTTPIYKVQARKCNILCSMLHFSFFILLIFKLSVSKKRLLQKYLNHLFTTLVAVFFIFLQIIKRNRDAPLPYPINTFFPSKANPYLRIRFDGMPFEIKDASYFLSSI